MQKTGNDDVYNYTYQPPTLNNNTGNVYPQANSTYQEPSAYDYNYGSSQQANATNLPPPPVRTDLAQNEAPAQQMSLSKLELQSKISGILNVISGSIILALTVISLLLWVAGLIGNVTLIWWSLIFYAVDLLMHVFYCGGAAIGIGSGILFRNPEKLNLRYILSVGYASFLIVIMIVHLVIRPVLGILPSVVQTVINASEGRQSASDVNIIILSLITTLVACSIGFIFCAGFLLVAIWQIKVIYDKRKLLKP